MQGSTNGIGKAFAFEFAKKGFNIVMLSRDMGKMSHVEEEIKKTSKVKIKKIQADFSQIHQYSHYEDIADQMKDLDVSILINNAGVG